MARSSAPRSPGCVRATRAASTSTKRTCKARDSRDDLVLHLKQIGTVRIELICPQMRAGLGVDELRAHAHPVAALLLAPLQHIAHPKLPAVLLYVAALPLLLNAAPPRHPDALPTTPTNPILP